MGECIDIDGIAIGGGGADRFDTTSLGISVCVATDTDTGYALESVSVVEVTEDCEGSFVGVFGVRGGLSGSI